MNISQAILTLIVIGLIFVLILITLLALSFVLAYKKGNYHYCIRVVRRVPFIVDSNGIITPEMVCAAAIRAHDFQFATLWLGKATRQGISPIHRFLELALLAEQSQWEKAEQVFALFSGETANSSQDIDDEAHEDMKKLAQYIEDRNETKIEELGRKLV